VSAHVANEGGPGECLEEGLDYSEGEVGVAAYPVERRFAVAGDVLGLFSVGGVPYGSPGSILSGVVEVGSHGVL